MIAILEESCDFERKNQTEFHSRFVTKFLIISVLFSKKATAEANNVILQNDCLNLYVDSMQKSLDATQSYYNEFELDDIHQRVKDKAMKQVRY